MTAPRISAVLRQQVAEAFHFRCGYCQTSQRIIGPLLEIDHIIPEAQGGTSAEDNLCLACPMCNSHKADRIEAIDPDSPASVRLFNPRAQNWEDHFEWIETGTLIRGKSPIGRATIAALNMNHPDVVLARQLWVMAGWHPPRD